jgi:hypothetical protein
MNSLNEIGCSFFVCGLPKEMWQIPENEPDGELLWNAED